jgi:hypothetical protein
MFCFIPSAGIQPRDSNESGRIGLLEDDATTLSIQVLQEFYVQATRAARADAISHELAAGLMECWTRFRVQDMNLEVLQSAYNSANPPIFILGLRDHRGCACSGVRLSVYGGFD